MNKQILKPIVLPVFVFVLGAILSIFIWNYVRSNFLKQSLLDFESRVGDVAQLVEARLNRDAYMLYGVRGLFSSSDSVSRAEFDTYARSINFIENYPGITGIAYQELVRPEDRDHFVESIKNDKKLNGVGYPDFKIFPEPHESSSSLVVNYIYPSTVSNTVAFGFDAFSDPYRKLASEKARDLNTSVITAKVVVFPDKKDGFLMTLPIYKNNTSTATVAERRENILGFVTASFVAEHFFGSIFSAGGFDTNEFDLLVYNTDGEEKFNGQSVIFDLNKTNKTAAPVGAFVKKASISIGDRVFVLDFFSNPTANLTVFEKQVPTYILVFSLMLSLIVSVFIYTLSISRSRAVIIAAEKTIGLKENEAKFKAVTESAKDAIVMMDDQGKIVLWNKAAESMFGRSAAEVLGTDLHSIVPFEKEHQTKKDNLTKFSQTGESPVLGKSLELPVKNKRGEKMMVELTVARANLNGHWHAVGIMRNITDRKRDEEMLVERAKELERMNKSMVGRELKMAELKAELAELKKEVKL